MSSSTLEWIAAGKILSNNPEDKVICPECKKDYLKVQDVKNDSNPNELERYIFCQSCGSKNILRLRRTI